MKNILILSLLVLGSCKEKEPVCVTDVAQGTWYNVDDPDYTMELSGRYLSFDIPNHGIFEWGYMNKECDNYNKGRDTFNFDLKNDTLYMEHINYLGSENTKWIRL